VGVEPGADGVAVDSQAAAKITISATEPSRDATAREPRIGPTMFPPGRVYAPPELRKAATYNARQEARVDTLILIVIVGLTVLGGSILAFGDPSRVGVAGTLLGGVLGFVTALGIERFRQRNEAAHRFEQERRAVYVGMIESGNEIEQQTRDRMTALAMHRHEPDLKPEVPIPPDSDYAKIEVAAAEIQLLAPISVAMQAKLYLEAVRELDFTTIRYAVGAGIRQDVEDSFLTASEALINARQEFLRAAHRDLDLPTGVTTTWQERLWRL